MRQNDLKNEQETPALSPAEIGLALSPYAPKPLSESELVAMANYLALLKKWNETIPLTSIEGDTETVTRHFGESIFAGRLLNLERGRLADVGSGAGFPGLPLKIIFPELQVTLIEPNLKKCAFLREVQETLCLSGLEIVRSRYEDFKCAPGSFDFVCSRALGRYRQLLRWSTTALAAQGRVALWIGAEDANMLANTRSWLWDLPAKLPDSRRRVVLSGRPLLA